MMRVQAKQNMALYFFRKSEAKNDPYQPLSYDASLHFCSDFKYFKEVHWNRSIAEMAIKAKKCNLRTLN